MEDFNCCSCGVRIYVDDRYYAVLKREKKTFYCINGHSQSFTESDTDRLKKQHEIIDSTKNKIINKLQDKLKVLENKNKCMLCKKPKQYSCKGNLDRHIHLKHPLHFKN
jgi:hypothetical protein